MHRKFKTAGKSNKRGWMGHNSSQKDTTAKLQPIFEKAITLNVTFFVETKCNTTKEMRLWWEERFPCELAFFSSREKLLLYFLAFYQLRSLRKNLSSSLIHHSLISRKKVWNVHVKIVYESCTQCLKITKKSHFEIR